MAFIPNKDYLLDIGQDAVPKNEIVIINGRANSVGAEIIDIGMENAVFVWRTTATKIEIISTDPSDDSAGLGAQVVTVKGVDDDFNPIEEDIPTNGTSPTVESTLLFRRVNESRVKESGTYAGTNQGGNNGDITIRPSGGGDTMSFISGEDVDAGVSQDFKFTVPNGFTASLMCTCINVEGRRFGNIQFNVRGGADIVTAPFTSKSSGVKITGLTGLHVLPKELLNENFPAKTDIWMSCFAGSVNTEISATMTLILIED